MVRLAFRPHYPLKSSTFNHSTEGSIGCRMSLEDLGKKQSRDSSLMGSDAGFGWVIPDVSKERSALISKD